MRSGRRSPAPPDDGAPEAEEDPDAAADPAADPEPDPDADPESVPDAACGAATRFRPGRSGNPHGAPRRPPPRTAEVERLLARPWGYWIDGRLTPLPFAQAFLMRLAERAMDGERWAATEVLKLMADAERIRAGQDARRAETLRRAAEARAAAEAREAARRAAHAEALAVAEAEARAAEARAEAARAARETARIQRDAYLSLLRGVGAEDQPLYRHAQSVYEASVALGVLGDAEGEYGLRSLRPWTLEAARDREPDLAGRLTPEQRRHIEIAMGANATERALVMGYRKRRPVSEASGAAP